MSMNPTDPAFPVPKTSNATWVTTGMDLRTYIATACLAQMSKEHSATDAANMAVEYADALIARLNAK